MRWFTFNDLSNGAIFHFQYVLSWSVELHRLQLPWFVSSLQIPEITRYVRWKEQVQMKNQKCLRLFAGECSVTGDMYFQSFDGRIYTFSATCQYVLAKSRNSGRFTVTIQNTPCGAVSLILEKFLFKKKKKKSWYYLGKGHQV